jgi:hypothetical protein
VPSTSHAYDDWDDYPSEPEEEEYPRDSRIDITKQSLGRFFSLDENKNSVFYLTQLQVIFERSIANITDRPTYHWITAKAIGELVDEGVLNNEYASFIAGQANRTIRVRFIFHPRCRYTRRAITRKTDIIRRFSEPNVTRAAGALAEVLFSRALLLKGFKEITRKATHYGDVKWTQSGHDLDFIVERDGVAYGCEIKNRFEYISREELAIKLQMCKTLGVRPLFIMRASPQSYNFEIINSGGFVKIFDWHIYPYGFEELAAAIRNEFPGMPAYCVMDLPNTILDRIVKLHDNRQWR